MGRSPTRLPAQFGYTIIYVPDGPHPSPFRACPLDFLHGFCMSRAPMASWTQGATTLAFADHALGHANFPSGHVAHSSEKPLGMEIAAGHPRCFPLPTNKRCATVPQSWQLRPGPGVKPCRMSAALTVCWWSSAHRSWLARVRASLPIEPTTRCQNLCVPLRRGAITWHPPDLWEFT